jgi:plasmid maintenance system antidote protein VapI
MNTKDLIEIRGNAIVELTNAVKNKVNTLMSKMNWTAKQVAYYLALNESDVENMLNNPQKMSVTALLTILVATNSMFEIIDLKNKINVKEKEEETRKSDEDARKAVEEFVDKYDEMTRKELCEYVKQQKLDDKIDLAEADRSQIIDFLIAYDKQIKKPQSKTQSADSQFNSMIDDFNKFLANHPELRSQLFS